MLTNVFQPSNQATNPQQDLQKRLERSLLVGGKPADADTIRHVLEAKEKPAPRGRVYTTPPFNIMR